MSGPETPIAPDEPSPADPRERLRRVREAGRDAVREARRVARETNREARENAVAAIRDARQQVREEVFAARRAGRPSPGEAGTRTRIQQVALQLFTENGYDATSLREIAERLGVTKAALYYHFKTKDDIVASLVEDRVAGVGELVEWARTQPRTVETRRELVHRYSDMLYDHDHHVLMQFFERNQSSIAKHPAGAQMREQLLRLLDFMVPPDAPLTDRIRSSLAIFVLHSVWFTIRDPAVTEEERSDAALEVALELVE